MRNSVNSIIVNLSEFKFENDYNNYIEQTIFSLANSVEDNNKKKTVI